MPEPSILALGYPFKMAQIPPSHKAPFLPVTGLTALSQSGSPQAAESSPQPKATWQQPRDHMQFCPVGEAESKHDLFEIVDPWAAPDLAAVAAGDLIKKYDEGPPVLAIQQRLNVLGHTAPETGVLDTETLSALNQVYSQVGQEPRPHFDASSLQILEQAEQSHAVAKSAEAAAQAKQEAAIEHLKSLSPTDLHQLGRKDPQAFFKALLPAALESQKEFGIPAALTLAQGALESDYARSPIGGYNIFGIKGQGPAGAVNVKTREVFDGKETYIKADFARYNNFYEAVKSHGQLFHNGYYDKAMAQYQTDGDMPTFIENIATTYATAPNYSRAIQRLIETHDLLTLTGAQ